MNVVIDMKTAYGNYRQFTKEFKDENHLNNWCNLMSRKSHKIIGVHYSECPDCGYDLTDDHGDVMEHYCTDNQLR